MTHGNFWSGFFKSWGVILASEIGDKTFFIAAIMAMRNPRGQVFAGAIAALAAMTVLSALMGWAAPTLISKTYTHYAAMLLFFFFGVRMLYDAAAGTTAAAEDELEEVERELQESKGGAEGGKPRVRPLVLALRRTVSPIVVEAFSLTFLAEWGDRSQIATIGLAAASNVVGVTLGGVLGHSLCTGAAVLGGRHLAEHINERAVAVFGGLLFLVFGLHSAVAGPPE